MLAMLLAAASPCASAACSSCCARLDAHRHQHARDFALDRVEQLAEQLERLALVFLLRVLLRVAAQVDALAQVVERGQVLAPVRVDALQHHLALELRERSRRRPARPWPRRLRRRASTTLLERSSSSVIAARGFSHFAQRQLDAPLVGQRLLQARRCPTAPRRFRRHVLAHQVGEARRRAAPRSAPRCRRLRAARCAAGRSPCAGRWRRRRTRAAACGCRSCAPRPCAARSRCERVTMPASIASPSGIFRRSMIGLDAVAGEDAQQRVLQRQVEARGARVALAAGAAAQLVVDAARLVALGADDVQAARATTLVVQLLPLGAQLRDRGLPCRRRRSASSASTASICLLDVAAQHDVGAAARHVGGDGDHLRAARLRHDLGLARVLLGVEHLVRQLVLVQQARR